MTILTQETPKTQPQFFYRQNMTAAEVDEINEAERLAEYWQTEARRTGREFANRMARRYTDEAFIVAQKLGVATCVKPFEVTP
jgi:hypothetical protein